MPGIYGQIWQRNESDKAYWWEATSISCSSWYRPQGKGLERDKVTEAEITTSEESATEFQMAMGLILGADRQSFRKLIEDLDNQHTQGMKSFPQTVSEAFILLNNWKNSPRIVQQHDVNEGVAFATKNEK